MKSVLFGLAAALLVSVGPAHAQQEPPAGDSEAGAAVFKKCLACHKVGPDARNRGRPRIERSCRTARGNESRLQVFPGDRGLRAGLG